MAKKLSASSQRQVEHVGDGLAPEGHLEGVAVVAGAVADLARHVDVGQEVHLDLDRPVAGAGLAAPAPDVEGEPARLVAADLGLGGLAEEPADVVEDPGVGGRVRPRRAADRRLVDVDHLVDVLACRRRSVAPRDGLGPVELVGERPQQDVVDEGRLPRAGHPGHRDEAAERERDVDVAQVVLARAPDHDRLAGRRAGGASGTGIERRPDR